MTKPKEKANELFYKFNGFNTYGLDKMCCKKSAEFLCDEMIGEIKLMFPEPYKQQWKYWQQVKDEINNL